MALIDEAAKCETPYVHWDICVKNSTFGKTVNFYSFGCMQRGFYGGSGNLQMKHDRGCWIWEEYGYETLTIFFVSSFRIDSISRSKIYIIFFQISLQTSLICFYLLGVYFCVRRARRRRKRDESFAEVTSA